MNNRASNDEVSEAELAQLLLEYIQQPDLHTTQRVNADNIDPRNAFPYRPASPLLPGRHSDPITRAEIEAYEEIMGFSSIPPSHLECIVQLRQYQKDLDARIAAQRVPIVRPISKKRKFVAEENNITTRDGEAVSRESVIHDRQAPVRNLHCQFEPPSLQSKQDPPDTPAIAATADIDRLHYIESRRQALKHGAKRIKWNGQRLLNLTKVDNEGEILIPEWTSVECNMIDGRTVRIRVGSREANDKVNICIAVGEQEWKIETLAKIINFDTHMNWSS